MRSIKFLIFSVRAWGDLHYSAVGRNDIEIYFSVFLNIFGNTFSTEFQKKFCCRSAFLYRENLIIHIFVQIKSYDADHDNNYEPNLNCQWLVVGEPGKVLKLTFTTFNIEQDQNDTLG